MANISPTKASAKPQHTTSVGVVTKSQLGSGHYHNTFPSRVEGGAPNTFTTPRNGPDESGMKKARMTK